MHGTDVGSRTSVALIASSIALSKSSRGGLAGCGA
jgi:hypothetical protein